MIYRLEIPGLAIFCCPPRSIPTLILLHGLKTGPSGLCQQIILSSSFPVGLANGRYWQMFEGHHSDIRIFISQVPFQVPSQGCLSQLSKVHTFCQVSFSYSFLCTLATMQSSCSSGPKGSPLFLVLGSCTILCWISPTLLTPLLTVPLINFPQLHHLYTPSFTYKDTD